VATRKKKNKKYLLSVDKETNKGYNVDKINKEAFMEATAESRVRMNIKTTAKGWAQLDVTVEFATVEESESAMSKAIDSLRKVLKEKEIVEAHE